MIKEIKKVYLFAFVLSLFSCVQLFVTPWTVAPRLLCPWVSPGKSTGVGCRSLLQGILPIQGSNPGLLHCRQILLPSEPPGKLLLLPTKTLGKSTLKNSGAKETSDKHSTNRAVKEPSSVSIFNNPSKPFSHVSQRHCHLQEQRTTYEATFYRSNPVLFPEMQQLHHLPSSSSQTLLSFTLSSFWFPTNQKQEEANKNTHANSSFRCWYQEMPAGKYARMGDNQWGECFQAHEHYG